MALINKIGRQELIAAILEGDVEKVRRLVMSTENYPILLWPPGYNFLYEALKSSHHDVAKLLIRLSYHIPSRHNSIYHLHTAVINSDLETVKLLVEKGCSLKVKDEKERSPLHAFVERVPVDQEAALILEYILSKKVSINVKHTPTGFTPIHFAAKIGNCEMISLLIEKKSHINSVADLSQTPLHIAAANRQPEAVRVLLQHRAKLYSRDDNLKTPLCLAVETQHMPTIETILSCKSVLNDEMLFDCALETNNIPLIQLILQKGAKPYKHSPKTGKKPIQVAVESGNENLVRILLQNGANANEEEIDSLDSRRHTGRTMVHIAAERIYPVVLQTLLEYGAKLNVVDERGLTALHYATRDGSLPIIYALLKSGCDFASLFTPEKQGGYTPLHIAVECGYEDLVKLFLEVGIPVNSSMQNGFHAIHLAVLKKNLTMVQLLLKYGASSNVQAPDCLFGFFPMYLAAATGSLEIVKVLYENSNRTPHLWLEGFFSLYAAAYQGHEEIVQFFIEKGTHLLTKFLKFLSPLHVASQQGFVNIVNLLLKNGLEVNSKVVDSDKKEFSTPLITASVKGHEKVVEILLNHGADVNARLYMEFQDPECELECFLKYGYPSYTELLAEEFKNGYSAMHFAARNGNKAIVEMLLRRGADINSKAENNATPLCVAIEKQQEDMVAYLLENGANPNADDSGVCALLSAIFKQNAMIVDLLLMFKATLNFSFILNSKEGYTPLHLAIEKSSVQVVEVLLKYGAFIDVDTQQDFPLHLATICRREDMIIKLFQYGASINSFCSLGFSPLFHSVKRGGGNIFKLLVAQGASIEMESKHGLSLLDLAIETGVEENLMKLIIECGADVNQRDKLDFPLVEKIMRQIPSLFMEEDGSSKPRRFEELVEILLKNGLDVNTRVRRRDEDLADSILHLAIHENYVEIVEHLLYYDADINIVDQNGHTPFWYAVNSASSIIKFKDGKGNCKDRDLDIFNYQYFFFTYGPYEPHIYEDLCKKCEKFKSIARFFTQAIARREAIDGILDLENLSLINGDFVKSYYKRCQMEIEEMKKAEISNHVSYFDILKASERKLATYTKNINIVKTLQIVDYRKQFPLYSEDLRVRFERGLERKNLLEISVKFLNKALMFSLPSFIVQDIFSYLSSVDLRNLCRAHKPLLFVSPDSEIIF